MPQSFFFFFNLSAADTILLEVGSDINSGPFTVGNMVAETRDVWTESVTSSNSLLIWVIFQEPFAVALLRIAYTTQ